MVTGLYLFTVVLEAWLFPHLSGEGRCLMFLRILVFPALLFY